MQEKRMFRDVKTAKFLLPAWLSPFVAFGFVLLGQIVGGILMGIFLGPILLMVMGSSSQGEAVLKGIGGLPMQIQDLFLLFE